MLKKASLAVIVLCAISTSADARSRWPNWYIGLNGNVPFVQDTNIAQNGADLGDMELDTGIGAGIAIGYTPNGRTASPLRYEFEYMYRDNDVDSIGTGNGNGNATSHSAMFNTYYDFGRNNNAQGINPYLGAGIGWTDVTYNSTTLNVHGSERTFAYQLMAGLGYSPKMLPNTVWSIGYRYFSAIDDIEVDDGTQATIFEYDVHSVELGARFRF